MDVLVNSAFVKAIGMIPEAAQKYMQTKIVQIKRTRLSDVVSNWGDKFGLGEETQKEWQGITKVYSQGEEHPTVWNLVNAATQLAQSQESPQVREDMEKMAGTLVWDGLQPHYQHVETGDGFGARMILANQHEMN
jgi:hypothetical protein